MKTYVKHHPTRKLRQSLFTTLWGMFLKRKILVVSSLVLLVVLPIAFMTFQYIGSSEAAWLNGSWKHRKELFFNNTAQAENLTNFPVMVKLTNTNFNFAEAQQNGADLRFTDVDGITPLAYEIETFNSASQSAVIWVKVPQINATSSTDSIYMYWGNPTAPDAQSVDNTWHSNYKGVYHLNDATSSTVVTDSSGLNNNLIASENTTNGYSVEGQIGKSFVTAGTPTYITNQSGNNIIEQYPDIVLDSNGYPIITYYDATNQDLVLVHCNDKECKGENEVVSVVDSSGNTGLYPSIRLDSNGYPMIAYYYSTGADLKYVHCNDVNCSGGDETFSVIDSTSSVGYYPRMILDGAGYPVIAYYYGTGADLKLVHCGNVNCNSGNVINTIDSGGTVGNGLHGTDVVLDGAGYPVISYYDTTNTELKVAHCNDANCSGADEAINSPVSVLAESLGQTTAIELDASGFPMVAYYNTTDTDLEYIHCNDANCAGDESLGIVKIETAAGMHPSLEKNSAGLPIIVAAFDSGTYLRVYQCNDTNCSARTTTNLGLYNQYSSQYPNFRLDNNNNIYAVSYARGKTNSYDAIYQTTFRKLEKSYDSDFDFGTGSFSISTWFKTNGMAQNTHILSRYDADQGYKLRLNYAGKPCFEIDDDASWGPDDAACSTDSQIITNVDNNNGGTAIWPHMALDANGYPVIAYFDDVTDDLELIHCNDVNCAGGNESFASIDVTGDVGRTPSLILDSSGYPVIAYHDNTNNDLKIVHCGNANCTSGNSINTLDGIDDVGDYPTVKLDGSGYPVVVYYDTTNTAVKLVHCNDVNCAGSNESIVTLVNDEDDRVRHGSEALQLDSSGNPMVVYLDNTNGDLEYIHCNDANCDGVGETKTTIESTNVVGDFASMTLDSNGYPVIAHFDGSNLGLRVVHCGNTNCNSGNTISPVAMPNSGDGGYYSTNIKLNNLGNPVILSTQLASWSTYLTVCNDVNCSGNNETHSQIRGNVYNYVYHSLAIDSNGYPVLSFALDGWDLGLIHLNNATTFTPVGSYDDGAWHHLVAVKNGISSLTLYMDGVIVGNDTSLAATGTLTSNSASFNLAQQIINSFGVDNWGGQLDEIQVDTNVRSSSWVAAQYLSESNTFITFGQAEKQNNNENNPVAYWKFDEGYGAITHNTTWKKIGTTTNHIKNPSFENGTNWWDYGYWSPQTTNLYDDVVQTTDTNTRLFGTSSGKIAITNVDGLGAQTQDLFYSASMPAASAGQTWSASNWVKIESNSGITSLTLVVACRNNVGGWITSSSDTVTAAANWTNLRASATCGATTADVIGYLYINGIDNGDSIALYTDGWQLEQTSYSNIYCDGSLPGSGSHVWTGTAHASTSICDVGNDAGASSTAWQTEDQCVSGKCLSFNGTSSYVYSANDPSLNPTTAFTIESWVKPAALANNTNYNIVAKQDWGNKLGYRLALFGYGGCVNLNCLSVGVGNGTTQYEYSSPGVNLTNLNTWYHVATTYDNGTVTVYLNGIQKSQTSSGVPILSNTSGAIAIGRHSSGGEYFPGKIDDTKIYPYVRTPAQIKADFSAKGGGTVKGTAVQMGASNNNSNAFSEGLVGYWKMNETSGNFSDSSGNNNNGTVSGSNNYDIGKFGNSFRAGVATTNMVTNPSLETNMTSWSYQYVSQGSATTSTDRAMFGSYSLKITRTVAGSESNVYYNVPGLQNSTQYYFSTWAWASTPNTACIWSYNAGVNIPNVCHTGSSQWERIGGVFTTSAAGVVQLRLAHNSADLNSVYYDGMQVELGTTVTSYIDGTLGAGYAWTGTAHASTSTRTASSGSVVNSSSLDITGNKIAFSTWIKPISYAPTSSYSVIFQKLGYTSGYRMMLSSTGKIYIGIGETSGGVHTSTASIPLNSWSHVVMSYDGQNIKIFIDGVLDSTKPYTNNLITTSNAIIFGSTEYSFLHGFVDEVRIYNRSLSPKEIQSLYKWAQEPVVYYNFEEGTGNAVYDVSGNNNTGTNNGGTWTSGKYGKALSYDGVVNGVNSTLSNPFSNSQWTFGYWYKPKLLGVQQNHMRIDDSGALIRVVPYVLANNTFGIWTNNGSVADSTTIAALNTWYYISGTYENGTLSLYINGVKKSSATVALTPATWNRIFYIGTDGGGFKTTSAIDEFKIYNYARTPGQIIEDMNAGHPIGGSPVGSQVGYYKFDEGYGTVAHNSGSGGTAINGIFGAAPPTWTNAGKYGKALSFNDTYVSLSSITNLGSSFSFSAWINPTAFPNTHHALYGASQGVNSIICSVQNTGELLFRTSSVGAFTDLLTVGAGIQRNNWYHVTYVYDGSKRYIYVNGVLKGQDTTTNWTNTISANGSIGRRYANSLPFYGLIDEVKMYSLALSPDEIKLDYNQGSAMILGAVSNTSNLSGGSIASNSASAQYCIPGDSSPCNAPVGEWNFEEGQNSSTGDTSGNSNNGALNGATAWIPGKIGKALGFNGTTGYVDVGNGSSLNTPSALTLSAWVKPKSNDGNWSSIVSKSAKQAYFLMQRDTNQSITFGAYLSDGYKEVSINTADIILNEWQHITATYDGANEKLYLNGVLKATTTATGTINNISTNTLLIGSSTVASERFNGDIDQVRVYSYARTPSQVSWDYNKGKPVGHWKFDECQGTVANDSSGYQNNGTITIGATIPQSTTGTCTDGLGTSAWNNGKVGRYNSSLAFDGVDDEVGTADTPSLDMAHMTVSAWIKTSSALEQYIVERNNSTFYFRTGGGKLCYWINSVAGTWTCSIKSVNDNAWHHVLATWDGANKKLYIDGQLDTTAAGTGGDMSNATYGLTIGVRRTLGVPQYYFNGQIDDVRLYNYALTPTLIKQVYNIGSINFGPSVGSP